MIKLKCFLIFLLFLHFKFAHANELKIQERIENFKVSKKIMKKIHNSILKNEYSYIKNEILFLYNWFEVLPAYFPRGTEASVENSSDASSEIWENFKLFEKYSNNAKNISLTIFNSINQKDLKNIEINFDSLSRSCSTCHKKFRN